MTSGIKVRTKIAYQIFGKWVQYFTRRECLCRSKVLRTTVSLETWADSRHMNVGSWFAKKPGSACELAYAFGELF